MNSVDRTLWWCVLTFLWGTKVGKLRPSTESSIEIALVLVVLIDFAITVRNNARENEIPIRKELYNTLAAPFYLLSAIAITIYHTIKR